MGIFCYLGHGNVWHMRGVCHQFCPCFSFRLLVFPVSVLVSPSSASQLPNAFTPWTLMNITECTVDPTLLCHIKPTAHVHTLCVWWKYRVWCFFKVVCSCIQLLPDHAHVLFHGKFLISVYIPSSPILLSTGGWFSIKLFPFWTLLEYGMLCDQDCISAANWVPVTARLQTRYCRTSGKQTSISSRSPARLPWGAREQNRAGRSLVKSSTERKSWQFPGVRNWSREMRDQCGRVGNFWSN